MGETNGATCGSPISMQDVKIEFQSHNSTGGRIAKTRWWLWVCVCERWIEEEMRWQVVGVFSA